MRAGFCPRASTNRGSTSAAHTSIGQEGEIVGACMALRDDDYMVGNHRSHGHPIGQGADSDLVRVAQVDRAGDIVARGTIAPRCAEGELPLLVAQIDGHAVDFRFHDPLEFLIRQKSLHAGNKLVDLHLRVGVVQAHHRSQVLNGVELF